MTSWTAFISNEALWLGLALAAFVSAGLFWMWGKNRRQKDRIVGSIRPAIHSQDSALKKTKTLVLTSPSFQNDGPIPEIFTGEGSDLSPPLRWSGVPGRTREFALLCEDTTVSSSTPFVHWLVYNISPSVTSLPEGLPSSGRLELPVRADQGLNSFGSIGYHGPLPSYGHDWHQYEFTLYALDQELALAPGASREEFLKAIHHHVLVKATLKGIFRRELSVTSPAA